MLSAPRHGLLAALLLMVPSACVFPGIVGDGDDTSDTDPGDASAEGEAGDATGGGGSGCPDLSIPTPFGTCVCPDGSLYDPMVGCEGDTGVEPCPPPTDLGPDGECLCPDGSVFDPSTWCLNWECPPPTVSDGMGWCLCPDGVPLDPFFGCNGECPHPTVPNDMGGCSCPNGNAPDPGMECDEGCLPPAEPGDDGLCACPDGSLYDPFIGCLGTCGNGTIEGYEWCDGAELGGLDCTALGYAGGVLACTDDCMNLDMSGCEGAGACAHDLCISGDPLVDGCDPCVTQICAVDPFCCDSLWDGLCVNEVSSICGQTCDGICPSPAAPGADGLCYCPDGLPYDPMVGCTECIWPAAPGKDGACACPDGSPYDSMVGCPSTCGNGAVEWYEWCDGAELGGLDCTSFGYTGGALACGADCNSFDTSACEGGGACAHDLCTTGDPLVDGCDPCVTQICAVDPFCCNSFWDGLCVNEVESVCGLSPCDSSVCLSPAVEAMDGTCECPDGSTYDPMVGCLGTCGNDIVEGLEQCDGTSVDGLGCQGLGFAGGGTLACAADCSAFDTTGCIEDGTGDCCVAHAEPGCDDLTCQQAVCAIDPFCCAAMWDGLCVNAAAVEPACADVSDACPEPAVCGNALVEPGESCDGAELGGLDCTALGFMGGALACQADCVAFDTSGCLP